MKQVFMLSFAIILMTFSIMGCVAVNSNNNQVSNEGYQYTDSASPIKVSPGEKFVIVIASNPTTGFSWKIAKPINENVIKLLNSEYIPARSGLIGAGGKEVWTFVAVAAGETSISLKYVRPWEKEKSAESEAIYTVIVR